MPRFLLLPVVAALFAAIPQLPIRAESAGAPSVREYLETVQPELTLQLYRKRNIRTGKEKITLRGTSSSNTTSVKYFIGEDELREKMAKGTPANWFFTVKLKKARTRVTICGYGPDGAESAPLVVRIRRK